MMILQLIVALGKLCACQAVVIIVVVVVVRLLLLSLLLLLFSEVSVSVMVGGLGRRAIFTVVRKPTIVFLLGLNSPALVIAVSILSLSLFQSLGRGHTGAPF